MAQKRDTKRYCKGKCCLTLVEGISTCHLTPITENEGIVYENCSMCILDKHYNWTCFYLWFASAEYCKCNIGVWMKMTFSMTIIIHDDVIKWTHFPRYWPFVRGIYRSPVNSPHKDKWRFDVFCDLRLKKMLSKQSRRRWFERPSLSLWRQCSASADYSCC